MKRQILVIGSGGREHAICKKLTESKYQPHVYCAKGNAGMVLDGIELVDISENNHQGLIDFCQKKLIDWVIIGPELPLLNGLVDEMKKNHIKVFGPTKQAAMIEGSKDFAKQLMSKYDIPTAIYESFTHYDEALNYIKKQSLPIVIKADGLAAGKGVVIAQSLEEADKALKEFLLVNPFNSKKPKVVVEEFLIGKEFSLLSFVNQTGIYPMEAAKDHKAIYDGDKGPNTGGMGAYSPVSYVTKEVKEQVIEEIIKPTVEGMKQENLPFEGVLYTGLILTTDGPKVIEYNARFGDPETQVLLERLESDLVDVIESLLAQEVPSIKWKIEGVTLGVVVSAKGYPETYETGIPLPNMEKELNILYSGVKSEEKELVSNGGRIFLACGEGDTLSLASQKVYEYLEKCELNHFYYRKDIGRKI